jgi:hypothetical protein
MRRLGPGIGKLQFPSCSRCFVDRRSEITALGLQTEARCCHAVSSLLVKCRGVLQPERVRYFLSSGRVDQTTIGADCAEVGVDRRLSCAVTFSTPNLAEPRDVDDDQSVPSAFWFSALRPRHQAESPRGSCS